jgi:osmoprotectant transport system permease protein
MADELLREIGRHVVLVGVAVTVASLLGIPAGVALASRPRAERLVLGAAGIVQTIPSLALFGFLIPLGWVGGIGVRTALVALTLYALLPLLRNTVTGVRTVDAAVREAGRGLGMTARQLRWHVELPLAAPVIVAGLRTATVTTVGTATIAAAIGAGGLGVFIFRGVAMLDTPTILAGAVPAALLALAADQALAWLERRLGRRS